MLQSILNKLKNNPKYDHIFNSKEKMSFVMLSTGHYRTYETGKIIFLILFGNEPKLLVKFYKSGDNMIQREFDIQKTMYEKCTDIISEPIEIFHMNNFKIMVENAYLGKSLERYFYDNPFKNEIQSIMKNVFAVYVAMEKVQYLSTYDELEKEITILVDKFNKSYCPNDKELSTINECVSILLKHFKNEKIHKRLSNGDFTPRNLIVNNSTIKLIDFEFAEETHLYFLDWFRFFKIQYTLANKYLYDILHMNIKDQYCLSALREYSNYPSKDKMDIACMLVSEIKEFVMRLSIYSPIFHNELKKEIQPLISEISSRLNEQGQSPNVINTYESNKDSSLEKMVFHNAFLKIYNYENTIAEQDVRMKNYEKYITEIHQSFVFRTLRKYDKTIGKIFPLKFKK